MSEGNAARFKPKSNANKIKEPIENLFLLSPLEGLLNYLQKPGKKVILVGENHNAPYTKVELYTQTGKQLHILEICKSYIDTLNRVPNNMGTVSKKWFKNAFLNKEANYNVPLLSANPDRKETFFNITPAPLAIYTEFSQDLTMSYFYKLKPDNVRLSNTVMMRYSILNNIPTYFRSFDKQNYPSNSPLSKIADDKYAADIRKVSESCEITVALLGLGHLPVISNLLEDLDPYLINTATKEIIDFLDQTYKSYAYDKIELLPNFQRMPVYDDPGASFYTETVIKNWNDTNPEIPERYRYNNTKGRVTGRSTGILSRTNLLPAPVPDRSNAVVEALAEGNASAKPVINELTSKFEAGRKAAAAAAPATGGRRARSRKVRALQRKRGTRSKLKRNTSPLNHSP